MFKSHTVTFDPETLQALQEAFDQALAEACNSRDGRVDEQSVRDMLALRIVTAARDHGERDPDRLKAYALQGFES